MIDNAVIRYDASRMLIKILIEVADGKVSWNYKTWRGSWKHKAPLSSLQPIPMFTTFSYYTRLAIWIFSLAVPVCILLFMTLGVTTFSIGSTIVPVAAISLLLTFERVIGPIRWAQFDSIYTNRDVYFFQGTNAVDFERFVENLADLIAASKETDSTAS